MNYDPLLLALRLGLVGDTADGRHIPNGMHAPWPAIKRISDEIKKRDEHIERLSNRLKEITATADRFSQ